MELDDQLRRYFGSDDFDNIGLVVFTIRNGDPEALSQGGGKLYAEKMLIINVDQHTPMHFHFRKTEDIINRGGGDLVIQLYTHFSLVLKQDLLQMLIFQPHLWR